MHKSWNLNPLMISLKPRHDAAILPKRMKLADEDSSVSGEYARSFTQDKPQILDVFEHEIARNQIDGRCFNGPGLGNIGDAKPYVVERQVLPGLLNHCF